MPASLANQLVVAISSRALFNFEEENRVFDAASASAYMQMQLERLDQPASSTGAAFPLIRKLLAFNTPGHQRVEVVIVSRNDPVSGLRVFRSAAEHGIALERGVFTQGRAPFTYLRPLGARLFLSANTQDVQQALALGFPAACVLTESRPNAAADSHPDEVRIAFDGDAVLFSDEAERIFREQSIEAFHAHEGSHARQPLPAGPFKPLLDALQRLQRASASAGGDAPMNVRCALVTARSAPAHERAIRTLMSWGVRIDEAMFLGGLPKGEFLREFDADFFFDDQLGNVQNAARHAVPSGHVAAPPAEPAAGSDSSVGKV